jgi:cellulose synthase/poly-beta-1,6-N-acetylglucosamine synthase-like glycosyltransferase
MSSLNAAIAIFFWACLGLIAYSYAIYPLLIWACSRLFGRELEASEVAEADLPTVSLLIAAYNEEAEIGARIRNALAMDYPHDRLEIVVGSDGSTDETCQIVRGFAGEGVRLLSYDRRRGKASILNASFPELLGEIVLLSDANTFNEPAAARKLVRWFRNPEVGIVCGRLKLTDPRTGRNADSLYWKYETFLKSCEGRLGALLGANGAIYAIRKGLYAPIPAETIVDDFVIPLLARMRTGASIVYDERAIAREETPPDMASEFHRRSRIGAGGYQSIGMLWKLLDPRQGWVAFAFLSHKILRWSCPFFLLGLLASNIALVVQGEPPFGYFLAAQVGFYLASLASACLPAGNQLLKPLRIAAMFTGMNAALLVGFFRWLFGLQKGSWRRTARLAESTNGGPRWSRS